MSENYRNRPQRSTRSPSSPPSQQTQGVPPSQSGSFFQTFGLDIRIAILVILVDTMLFSAEVLSMGLLLPFSLFSAGVLSFLTYRIQKKWYGDDHEGALIKAIVVGLITAIPAPITPLVAGPGGILGLVHLIRGKR